MLLRRVLCFAKNAKVLRRIFVHKNLWFSQIIQRNVINFYNISHKSYSHEALTTKLFTLSFTVMSIFDFTKKKDENKLVITTKEVVITKADALFDQKKYVEAHNLLANYKDSGDVEIIWRLCRVMYKLAMTASEVEANKIIYQAYDLILDVLKVKEDHWAVYKWASILLHAKCSYEGLKAQIRKSLNIRDLMLRAIELNPKDAIILYMLGNWCYQIANLTWYQRMIVDLMIGELPTSSFKEALEYFENAEKVAPCFYIRNLLMLAKTYFKLNQKEEAMKYLQIIMEYPAKTDDDHNAKQEAQKLLKNVQ